VAGYQIADEPTPKTLARFAVNPIFPFLAAMLGGVWLSWPWFAFNSFAVGSPTRKAELTWLAGGAVAVVALSVGLLAGIGSSALPVTAAPYAALLVTVVKLAVVYAVYLMQSRTIEIYQYYGGQLANGVWVLFLAFYVRGSLLEGMPVLAQLVLG
jgi:hypothetical protein